MTHEPVTPAPPAVPPADRHRPIRSWPMAILLNCIGWDGKPGPLDTTRSRGIPAFAGITVYSQLVLRLLTGAVLFYAGFVKAMAPSAEFAAVIDAYNILPASLTPPLALGLPYIEMGLGLYLLTGFMTRWSALAASGFFLAFIAALGSAKLRGIDLASCGCFGAITLSPSKTMLIDGVLCVAAVSLYFICDKLPPWSLDERLALLEQKHPEK